VAPDVTVIDALPIVAVAAAVSVTVVEPLEFVVATAGLTDTPAGTAIVTGMFPTGTPAPSAVVIVTSADAPTRRRADVPVTLDATRVIELVWVPTALPAFARSTHDDAVVSVPTENVELHEPAAPVKHHGTWAHTLCAGSPAVFSASNATGQPGSRLPPAPVVRSFTTTLTTAGEFCVLEPSTTVISPGAARTVREKAPVTLYVAAFFCTDTEHCPSAFNASAPASLNAPTVRT
jgi:hypothetical protein